MRIALVPSVARAPHHGSDWGWPTLQWRQAHTLGVRGVRSALGAWPRLPGTHAATASAMHLPLRDSICHKSSIVTTTYLSGRVRARTRACVCVFVCVCVCNGAERQGCMPGTRLDGCTHVGCQRSSLPANASAFSALGACVHHTAAARHAMASAGGIETQKKGRPGRLLCWAGSWAWVESGGRWGAGAEGGVAVCMVSGWVWDVHVPRAQTPGVTTHLRAQMSRMFPSSPRP